MNLSEINAPRFRLKLWSYDLQDIELACDKIKTVDVGVLKGPIRLPKEKRRWCLLKSPHVNKKSREHFEATVYNRTIEVFIRPDQIDEFGLFFS